MRAAAGGLALLVVLTAVVQRPSFAVQAPAAYTPCPGITGRVVTVTAREQYTAGRNRQGPRTKGDWTASQQAPRDWGSSFAVGPRVEYDADLGLILGAQASRTDYAFRRKPHGSLVRLTTEYATAADGLRTELIADVRRVNPRLRLELRARARRSR